MKQPIPQIETLAQETAALYEVLNNEADLARVVISTSYLDHALASLLNRFFIKSSIAEKMLNAPRGALSTFASRYDLAYCLGLIPKGLYQNLERLGEIRNVFAHNYLSFTLDHSDIASLINGLTFPTVHEQLTVDETAVVKEQPNPFEGFNNPRDKFIVIVIFVANRLVMTGLGTNHMNKSSGEW